MKSTARTLLLAACAIVAPIVGGTAHSGEVTIGLSILDGSAKSGTCHKTSFRGPTELVREYEKNQKSKLEKVEPSENASSPWVG